MYFLLIFIVKINHSLPVTLHIDQSHLVGVLADVEAGTVSEPLLHHGGGLDGSPRQPPRLLVLPLDLHSHGGCSGQVSNARSEEQTGPPKGAYNRTFPCMEANYPYAIKNQRGASKMGGFGCDELVYYGIRLLEASLGKLWTNESRVM